MPEVKEMTPPDLEQTKKDKAKPAKKKSKLKVNLIIIVALQLLLAGGGFFVVSNFIKRDPALQNVLVEERLKAEQEEQEEGDKPDHGEDVPRQICLLEDIIVNPAGTRGSRYLSVSIGVEMDAAPSGEEASGGHSEEAQSSSGSPIDNKRLQLRDALIQILSSKTILQLTTAEEKELIRSEILESFKEILEPIAVHRIYFVDFVLQ